MKTLLIGFTLLFSVSALSKTLILDYNDPERPAIQSEIQGIEVNKKSDDLYFVYIKSDMFAPVIDSLGMNMSGAEVLMLEKADKLTIQWKSVELPIEVKSFDIPN